MDVLICVLLTRWTLSAPQEAVCCGIVMTECIDLLCTLFMLQASSSFG